MVTAPDLAFSSCHTGNMASFFVSLGLSVVEQQGVENGL